MVIIRSLQAIGEWAINGAPQDVRALRPETPVFLRVLQAPAMATAAFI